MTFMWPWMLVSVLLVPLIGAYYVSSVRRRQQGASKSGTLGIPRDQAGHTPGFRRHLPSVLGLAGLATLGVALARPQAQVGVPRIEGTVILAFDVSGSMAATDLQPTRMAAAKAASIDFIQHQPDTVRIGVVAFSDNAFSVQPATYDRDAVLASINRLSPQRGTSLASGITLALNTIFTDSTPRTLTYSNLTPSPPTTAPTPQPVPPGSYSSAAIILLSDGENNELPDPLIAAKAAADRGVRIYTVGIGSATGTLLHINGFNVHTQLNEPMLQEIAKATGGSYYGAASAQQLSGVYGSLAPELTMRPQRTEVTALLALVGALVLMSSGLLSLLWFGRAP